MCAFAVVSDVLCLSAFVNLKCNMNVHANSGWLACTLDEARDQLQRAEARYKEEKSRMQQEITELHTLLKAFGFKRETKVE